MPNRLASERSPYLLQHLDNPVDWYPWGAEAFARARAEDRPVFLSVGYSTCHWCHVMAHESFENPQVAEVLNEHFVSIKVDREERPDVDRVYMLFVQATTGSGGWPMSVWLTPTLQPFYGGTYFPPTSRWGRPGFVEILTELARLWREERSRVDGSASTILERLRRHAETDEPTGGQRAVAGTDVLDKAVDEFTIAFDRRYGGFGQAPKFPRPSELLFLLREHARTGAAEPRDMALTTLRAMALGGMRDHLGGGFHRYSVDAAWRVPHFEKMLYDQAQLVHAYLDAAQASGDPQYADVAADTLRYVHRDLTDPAGGFHSAEDADSVPPEHAGDSAPHKTEGAFYVWADAEVRRVLDEDAEPFCLRYGIEPGGNAPFDPQDEFKGKNLLYVARSLEDVAASTGRQLTQVQANLATARQMLFDVRCGRPRPHRDDKVLTAWNGLMVGAFAKAGRVLGDASLVAAATRAAGFIRAHLWNASDETLLRRYRLGDAAVPGFAEDYAFLAAGLLELFQATGDPTWLAWTLALHRRLDNLFSDAEDGAWFSTTGADDSVLLRLKEQHDGAEPSVTSVAAGSLLTLAHLTGDDAMRHRAEKAIGAFRSHLGRAVPLMLTALSTYHSGVPQVVVVGDPAAEDTQALFAEVRHLYLPTAVVVPVAPAYRNDLARLLPWTAPMGMREGRATAYVCRDFTCRQPTTSAAELRGHLKDWNADLR